MVLFASRHPLAFSVKEKIVEGEHAHFRSVPSFPVVFHHTTSLDATTAPRTILNVPSGLVVSYLLCGRVAGVRKEAARRGSHSPFDVTLLVSLPALEALLPRHDRVVDLLGLSFFSGRLSLEELVVVLPSFSRGNIVFNIGTRPYGF